MSKPKALIICEKPSEAEKIKSCYEKHKNEIPYYATIVAQRGHLVTNLMPDELDESLKKWEWNSLPIFPEDYGGWKYVPIKEKKQGKFLTAEERLKNIQKELKSGNYDFVIHAGDADQEGELLVNLVLNYCKNKLPVKRFWTNDLTDGKILEALQNLKDDQKDPMLVHTMDAAITRQHLDWIYGLNMSRATSIQMNTRANVGRLKTVLVSIVCQREEEIKNFKPTTTYGIKSVYKKGFEGTLINPKNVDNSEYASEDEKTGVVWMNTEAEAQDLKNSLHNQVKIAKVTKKHTSTYGPKLFELSTAQMAAGKNGYDPSEVLSTIQSLYEDRYMSYPRTDCEFISPNEDLEGILRSLSVIDEFKDTIKTITKADIERVRKTKKWCDAKKIEESGHTALIPTGEVPDFSELTKPQKYIYTMICKRFIAMFLPPLEQDNVEIIGETVSTVDGVKTKKTFRSTGKTTTSLGWSEFFKMAITDTEIPEVKEGEILDVDEYKIVEKTTTCPKRFTEADLIGVCKNPARYLDDENLKKLGRQLSIGTQATRADTIKVLATPTDKFHNGTRGVAHLKLVKEGKREVLTPTEQGQEIINYLHGMKITKVDMTGEWEELLGDIRSGKKNKDEVYEYLISKFKEMLEEVHKKDQLPRKYVGKDGNSTSNLTDFKCPMCGKSLRKMDWGYACSGYKKDDENSCKYVLWKKQYGKELTESQLKSLVEKGKTNKIKFKSKKTGKDYEAILVLKADGTVGMEFPKTSKK